MEEHDMFKDIKDTLRDRAGATREIIAAVISIAAMLYLILVVSGQILKENRLEIGEVSLVILIGIAIVVILKPDLLQRLTLVKLPGGIEMTLHQIVRTQEKQQSELNDVRFMLTYLLSVAEHAHLQALLLGKADDYLLHKPLREELRKLKQLGLLEEFPGRSTDEVSDGTRIDLNRYFRLTARAHEYLSGIAKSAQDRQP